METTITYINIPVTYKKNKELKDFNLETQIQNSIFTWSSLSES